MNIRKVLAIILSLFLDAIDYIGGFLPFVGDFLDIMGMGMIYFLTDDPIALAGLIELLPFADFIPVFTLASLYSMYKQSD